MSEPSRRCHCGCGRLVTRRFAQGHNKRLTTARKEALFWAKVDVRGPDECWPWTGYCGEFGYGQVSGPRRSHDRAHRVAWRYAFGPIPDGVYVLHRCDNPPCCNPRHLFSGTHAENQADKVAKDRQARGEQMGHSRLTRVAVEGIRSRYACGGVLQRELAVEFGVSLSLISLIISRKRWGHAK